MRYRRAVTYFGCVPELLAENLKQASVSLSINVQCTESKVMLRLFFTLYLPYILILYIYIYIKKVNFIHLYLHFFILIQTYFCETERHTSEVTLTTTLADTDYMCDTYVYQIMICLSRYMSIKSTSWIFPKYIKHAFSPTHFDSFGTDRWQIPQIRKSEQTIHCV